MEMYCVGCKKLLKTKILALEELNRKHKYFNKIALFALRKNQGSLNVNKLVDYLVA